MKKILIIVGCVALVAVMASCKDKRSTGRAYMPDMYYSRAYETYAALDTAKFTTDAEWGKNSHKIYYTSKPVVGTMAIGDPRPYQYANDSAGAEGAKAVKNPLSADSIDMKEAERLYLVNCGICHGTKLDGNGPLYKDGNGPYPAKPKDFMADKAMTEGTMFHAATYGKGQMGSYASQLSTKQRWEVIAYIKNKQNGGAALPDTTKVPANVVGQPAVPAITTNAGGGGGGVRGGVH